jgi:hypothetical protein
MTRVQDFLVPGGQYSRKSFQQKLVEVAPKLFPHSKKRKWIKVHGVRTYQDGWQEKLKPYLERKLGDVWQISVPLPNIRRVGQKTQVDFYVASYTPRLLLFYSASTTWEYERTLKRLIGSTPGFGQMWVRPKTFEEMVMHFVEMFDPVIEEFRARRYGDETLPARIRPRMYRQVHWTASDSLDTLKELKELYGVRPYSVTMRLRNKGIIQVTDEGMMVITRINSEMFEAIDEALAYTEDEETRITTASQQMKFQIEKAKSQQGTIAIPMLVSGQILLGEAEFGRDSVERIKGNPRFEFFNSSEKEGSFSWVATAKDKEKKSLFGVSADERTIRLVPRPDVTFESFLDFYKTVVDEIDPTASFKLFSNGHRQ